MALKLMYITGDPQVAVIAENAGVERIFVDMEYIGKADRQGGMDTVQNHHTVEDICRIRSAVRQAQVLVRVNPIHEATALYPSSEEEINAAIASGADILMLPFFKTVAEVETFLRLVGGRVKTMLLVETPEAAEGLEEILKIPGIDEVYIGLNDLSLGYGLRFMFQLLADGTVEKLCRKCEQAGIPYGFGGIAALGRGALPAELVIREHYRLGSDCVILSRSFCNAPQIGDLQQIRSVFENGIRDIRALEEQCCRHDRNSAYFLQNQAIVAEKVRLICKI